MTEYGILSMANKGTVYVKLRKGIWWKAASLMGRTDRHRADWGLAPAWVPVGVWESHRSEFLRTTGMCTHASVIRRSCWCLWPGHFSLLKHFFFFIIGSTKPWFFSSCRWINTGYTLGCPVAQVLELLRISKAAHLLGYSHKTVPRVFFYFPFSTQNSRSILFLEKSGENNETGLRCLYNCKESKSISEHNRGNGL